VRKSDTDRFWSQRAASEGDAVHVNIGDVNQRELEYELLLPHLRPSDRLLEVGCGMGFSTARFRERVKHVDAFDYSEEMIQRAIRTYGETNNRFFHDDVLDARRVQPPYDVAVCVRVLINLRDLAQQKRALANLASWLAPGGRLLLLEGFRDGFAELGRLRLELGLTDIEPAKINFYSHVADLRPQIEADFEIVDELHLGAYDYLTRVVYPTIVGPENAKANSEFSEKCARLARVFNPEAFRPLSRVRGFALVRRG
jgi:SAM-dependent methyltransferase